MAEKRKPSKNIPKTSLKELSTFYNEVLNNVQNLDLQKAAEVDGLDTEIALFRLKIKSFLKDDPDNLKKMLDATNMLAKLIKTRNGLAPDQKNGLKEAIYNVMKDIAVPLGMTAITKKL
jgi:hypothetical protein